MADGGNAENQWALAPTERELVMTKSRANRLGFAILLTFFRERGRFPRDEAEVETQGIAVLSKQLDVPTPIDRESFLSGRTAERLHCASVAPGQSMAGVDRLHHRQNPRRKGLLS